MNDFEEIRDLIDSFDPEDCEDMEIVVPIYDNPMDRLCPASFGYAHAARALKEEGEARDIIRYARARGVHVRVIRFDRNKYDQYRHGQPDSIALRSEWADLQEGISFY